MNLAELVDWAAATLALLDDPATAGPGGISGIACTPSWASVRWRTTRGHWRWSTSAPTLIGMTLEVVRDLGLHAQAGTDLDAALPAAEGRAGELRGQLIEFVTAESSKVRTAMVARVDGSPRVALRQAQVTGASTNPRVGSRAWCLGLAAMVARLTPEAIAESFDRVRVRDVRDWCAKRLGVTVQSLRRQLYSPPRATKPG